MTNEATHEPDFRQATQAKKEPKAAVDGVAGMILAFGELSGTPEQGFQALTTDEILKWWKFPGIYHQKDWKADLRVLGAWSVTVELEGGGEVHANVSSRRIADTSRTPAEHHIRIVRIRRVESQFFGPIRKH